MGGPWHFFGTPPVSSCREQGCCHGIGGYLIKRTIVGLCVCELGCVSPATMPASSEMPGLKRHPDLLACCLCQSVTQLHPAAFSTPLRLPRFSATLKTFNGQSRMKPASLLNLYRFCFTYDFFYELHSLDCPMILSNISTQFLYVYTAAHLTAPVHKGTKTEPHLGLQTEALGFQTHTVIHLPATCYPCEVRNRYALLFHPG